MTWCSLAGEQDWSEGRRHSRWREREQSRNRRRERSGRTKGLGGGAGEELLVQQGGCQRECVTGDGTSVAEGEAGVYSEI